MVVTPGVQAASNQTGFILYFGLNDSVVATEPLEMTYVLQVRESKTCHRRQSEMWKISQLCIQGNEETGFSMQNFMYDPNQNRILNQHTNVCVTKWSTMQSEISKYNNNINNIY